MMPTIQKLSDIFDYAEYVSLCESTGSFKLPIGEFAVQAGVLCVARRMFNATDTEALKLFKEEATRQHVALVAQTQSEQLIFKPCGNCGGGEVR